jgi:hypothetical protein
MPAGPEETLNHEAGELVAKVAETPSSRTESTASTHPLHRETKEDHEYGDPVKIIHPHEEMPAEEGTAEERREKARLMNA